MSNFCLGDCVSVANPKPQHAAFSGCIAVVGRAFKVPGTKQRRYSVVLHGNGESVMVDSTELQLLSVEETVPVEAIASVSTDVEPRCARCGKPGRTIFGIGRCEGVALDGRRCGGALKAT